MKKNQNPKTWVEVFKAERKTFPTGYCATRVIPDKTKYTRKIKYKRRDW